MSYCDNCGLPLPEGAVFCPNCGAPVRRKTEAPMPSREAIGRILQAAVLGAFLSVMISSFSPQNVDLYFIPSFLSSLVIVYVSRARRLDEAVPIALAVYLFTDAIAAGLALGTLYSQNLPLAQLYGDYVPTLLDVVMYTAKPVTAIAAGYVGVRLTSKRQVKEPPPIAQRREEEPGGVIYSLETGPEKMPASTPHKV